MRRAAGVAGFTSAAVVLAAASWWLLGLGDEFHSANPHSREGPLGAILFYGGMGIALAPALIGWYCLQAAWQMLRTPEALAPLAPPPTPSPPPAPLLPGQQFADAARDAHLRRQSELAAAETSRDAEVAEAQALIEQAEALLGDSGVIDATLSALSEVWHWPSWSKRDDWQAPVPATDLRGRDGGGVEWTWEATAFGIRLEERSIAGYEDAYGVVTLWANGAEVLVLDVKRSPRDEYDRWTYVGVCGLVPGDWMAGIVDFAGAADVANELSRQSNLATYYMERSRKITLPDHED